MKPTFSEKSLWEAELQAYLNRYAVNRSSAKIIQYYEYDLSSESNSKCQNWMTVSSDLLVAKYNYLPASISLSLIKALSVTEYGESVTTNTVEVLTCNERAAVADIVDAVVSSNNLKIINCQDNAWVVSKCSTSRAVCVNCSDPCYVGMHCIESSNTNGMQPCISNTCGALRRNPAARVLSFDFDNLDDPPTVVSFSVNTTSTSAILTTTATGSGSIACGIFLSSIIPTASSSILLQNNVQFLKQEQAELFSAVSSFNNLKAITSYSVYCMATSPMGVRTPFSDVLRSKVDLSTKCCNKIAVSAAARTVRETTSFFNFLTVVADSAPKEMLQLRLSLRTVSGTPDVIENAFVPSILVIRTSAVGSALTLRASLTSTIPVGSYKVEIDLIGSSKADYSIVHTQLQGTFIDITANNLPLPAPVLTEVSFASDGSFIKIVFDSETDRGGQVALHRCDLLFRFPCDLSSTCQWVSATSVHAIINGAAGACISVGDNLQIIGNIRARCSANGECSQQSSWSTVAKSLNYTVSAPVQPIAPAVSIRSPDAVGACDSVLLDFSASVGSGGRSWKSFQWSVTSSGGANITEIQRFLALEYRANPPSPIPSRLLLNGARYTFTLTLCNFLDTCGQGTKSVVVLSTLLPTVSIQGSSLRNMKRKDLLTLSAIGSIATCDGKATSQGLSYRWTVLESGTREIDFSITLKNPLRFRLRPFSLESGKFYDIRVTSTMITTAVSSSAITSVYIEEGSIIAIVSGGVGVRTIRVGGNELSVDATDSYDEDNSDATLFYTWQCQQTYPSIVSNCSNIFENAHSNELPFSGPVLRLTTKLLDIAEENTVKISLIVSDLTLSRFSDQLDIGVSILPKLSPKVSVTSNRPNGIINPNQLLQLTGQVSLPVGYAGNAVWSVDNGLALRAAATTPVENNIPLSASETTNTFFLAIRPNSLPTGSTLTFSLTARMLEATVVASIQVTVNSPPQPGQFFVTPTEGFQLSDVFSFVAVQWQDTDLPLTFSFAYEAPSGLNVLLQARSESRFLETLLPAGSSTENSNVNCIGQIFDSLNSNSSVHFLVQVTEGEPWNNSRIDSFLGSSLSSADGNADGLKQATAFANHLLTAANCSHAPNCTALNRRKCFATAHTCGRCLSDDFVGDDGSSNSKCIPASLLVSQSLRRLDLSSVDVHTANYGYKSKEVHGKARGSSILDTIYPSGSPLDIYHRQLYMQHQQANRKVKVLSEPICTSNIDCGGGFYVCSNGECIIPSKSCSQDCNGHGVCRYRKKDTVISISDCRVGQFDCTTFCECEDGYVGEQCSLPEELEQKKLIRKSVVIAISQVIALEEVTEDAVVGWTNSLIESTQVTDHLSLNALEETISAIQTVITSAVSVRIPFTSVINLLDALNSVAEVQNSLGANHSSEIRQSLESLGNFVTAAMLPGENPYVASYNNMRVRLQIAEANITLTEPTTSLEELSGYSPSSMRIVYFGNQSQTDLKLSLISTSSLSLRDSIADPIYSNPLTIKLAGMQMCYTGECALEVELQNNFQVNYGRLSNITDGFNYSCKAGESTPFSYNCSDGYSVNGTCPADSLVDTVISTICPSAYMVGVCNALGSQNTLSGSQCRVSSYTDTRILCLCGIPVSLFNDSRRRLQSDSQEAQNEESSGFSVTYISMAESIRETFLTTIFSADDLNASVARNGLRVLLTLSVFVIVVVFALLWSHQVDRRVKKVVTPSNKVKLMNALKKAVVLRQNRRLTGIEDSSDVTTSLYNVVVAARKVEASEHEEQKRPRQSFLQKTLSVKFSVTDRRSSLKRAKRAKRLQIKAHLDGIDADLRTIEESLPKILGEQPFFEKLLEEIKHHHRWFAIVFFYSELFPRSLRVISLATNVVVMLFIQSLTYNLTNPDDGTCESFKTESDCLEPRSPYSSSDAKCNWTADDSSIKGESCSFIQPDENLKIILFIAVFSAAVATPIALIADWLIRTILAAPTRSIDIVLIARDMEKKRRESIASYQDENTASKEEDPRSSRLVQFRRTMSILNPSIAQDVDSDFEKLSLNVQRYRATLNKSEKQEFDGKLLVLLLLQYSVLISIYC